MERIQNTGNNSKAFEKFIRELSRQRHFFDLNSLLEQLQNAFEMRHIEDGVSEKMVKGYVKSVLRRIEVVQPVSRKEKAYYSIGITYCPNGIGEKLDKPKMTHALLRDA